VYSEHQNSVSQKSSKGHGYVKHLKTGKSKFFYLANQNDYEEEDEETPDVQTAPKFVYNVPDIYQDSM